MAMRSTTIWVCDRCKAEKELHGSCPYKAHIWFSIDKFEVGELRNAQLNSSKLLCDECARVLHDWWNAGIRATPIECPPES